MGTALFPSIQYNCLYFSTKHFSFISSDYFWLVLLLLHIIVEQWRTTSRESYLAQGSQDIKKKKF